MAAMTCELSSLVFAELYRLLASEKDFTESLESRLGEISYPLEWLDEAADEYDAKWEHDLEFMSQDTIDDFRLPSPDHAVLASWILAGLRAHGSCYALSGGIRTAVTQRVLRDLPGIGFPLPLSLSPVLLGWTLGRSVSLQSELPAAPAVMPVDNNVCVAFEGFIEHMLRLQSLPLPWPEVAAAAVYWRGYGIAEGLRPDCGGGKQALDQLVVEAKRSMEEPMWRQLNVFYPSLLERRNALSHVATDAGRMSFVDAARLATNRDDIDLAERSIIQFVFEMTADHLADNQPKSVRRSTWATLVRDITVWN